MPNADQLSALERLNKLRESGALSEDEFAAQKAAILSDATAPTAHFPFYRRLWVVVTLTCLILTFWIALIILLTGNVYKRAKDRLLIPLKKNTRYIYAGILALWLVAAIVNAIINPNILKEDKAGSTSSQSAPGSSQASDSPDACDSSDAADMVKSAIEESATSKIISTKVLDFGRAHELFFDRKNNVRYCAADGELNTGASKLSYKLYFGPSGGELVEVREGEDAFGANGMAAGEAALQQSASQQSQQSAPAVTTPETSGSAAPPRDNQTDRAANAPSALPNQQATPTDPSSSQDSPELTKCLATGDAANGVTSAMVECTNKELAVQNAKLNSTYKATMAALNPERQSALRDAQRKWIKFRDSKCDAENQSGGTIDEVGHASCVLDMTIQRTKELTQMQGQ